MRRTLVVLRKNTCSCFSCNWTIFFIEYRFYLKEWQIRLFRLEYLTDIFFKMNKGSCYFKENNGNYMLPMIKIEQAKIRLLVNLYPLLWLWHCKFIVTWTDVVLKVCIKLVNWYFPNVQCVLLTDMHTCTKDFSVYW